MNIHLQVMAGMTRMLSEWMMLHGPSVIEGVAADILRDGIRPSDMALDIQMEVRVRARKRPDISQDASRN